MSAITDALEQRVSHLTSRRLTEVKRKLEVAAELIAQEADLGFHGRDLISFVAYNEQSVAYCKAKATQTIADRLVQAIPL